ncbi:hypothetical protein ES689_01460 [Frigoribacterium sp. ACAM 257]|uniref:hypothetical protein n=1 Tax=Frigoribacterium sp. ACAM 257 TaxID=2508998 RepID=UPI0011B9AE39|nr:hypothetical protein [Frigoribacterium sp. ACAM 257]TWX40168.1 hypothetical protein ES689_01460 [Frigoribacterium sp. ACAM 257]
MDTTLTRPPLPPVRSHRFDAPQLREAAAAGTLTRLRLGSYVDSAEWIGLRRDEQARTRVREVVLRRRRHVLVSHVSAAVLWGLPLVGRLVEQADSLRFDVNGGRSEAAIRAHRSRLHCEGVELDGLLVTPIVRTLVDVALTEPLVTSVAAIDAALARGLVDPEALAVELARHGRARGLVRARAALVVASPASRSPLESLSAVRMFESHLERPDRQEPFPSPSGHGFDVDFFWRRLGLIGEADGDDKYSLRGEAFALEAVLAEKERENHLRGLGNDMVRWGWDEAWRPGALCRRLESHGVRVGRPWS